MFFNLENEMTDDENPRASTSEPAKQELVLTRLPLKEF